MIKDNATHMEVIVRFLHEIKDCPGIDKGELADAMFNAGVLIGVFKMMKPSGPFFTDSIPVVKI